MRFGLPQISRTVDRAVGRVITSAPDGARLRTPNNALYLHRNPQPLRTPLRSRTSHAACPVLVNCHPQIGEEYLGRMLAALANGLSTRILSKFGNCPVVVDRSEQEVLNLIVGCTEKGSGALAVAQY